MSEVVMDLLQSEGQIPADPPTIVLGQFERVGSTFYCDQLEKTHLVHNEPYKMLIPPHWPIARGYEGGLVSIEEFLESPNTPGVDKHWLRNFDVSLHYPGAQVIKETNLYLALPQFLDLFPYSDIELLSRNPLGIISSFKRNNLFERWNYARVADTLKIQIDEGRPQEYEELSHMLEEGKSWPTKLAWMIGLNAVLLSRHVEPARVKKIVAYEADIIPMGSPEDADRDQSQDSIFATNIYKTKDDFERRFNPQEMAEIVKSMSACRDFVNFNFDPVDRRWFDKLYGRYIDMKYTGRATETVLSGLGRVSAATQVVEQSPIVPDPEKLSKENRRLVQLHENQELLWDYSLVTNKQMGEFMQSMIENGFDPSCNYLLMLDNMPPARGGRITFDRESSEFRATKGFDNYPAYWVTWLGASLYAYKEGMRLPTQEEWQKVYDERYDHSKHPDANHTYVRDDACPTGDGEKDMPDDFFGNLKIWCADWSNKQSVSKSLAGISWKHYFHDEYATKTERPYLTNSRVIGIRLVCCSECVKPEERTMDKVMKKFYEVLDLMQDKNIKTADDLARLNQNISSILTTPTCKHNDGSNIK